MDVEFKYTIAAMVTSDNITYTCVLTDTETNINTINQSATGADQTLQDNNIGLFL